MTLSRLFYLINPIELQLKKNETGKTVRRQIQRWDKYNFMQDDDDIKIGH